MNILVLAGGRSSEREVSFASGSALAAACQRLGHTVRAVDPATGSPLIDDSGAFLETASLPPRPADTDPASDAEALCLEPLASSVSWADLIVIGLHGPGGEDGQTQRVLESIGKPFTGSSSVASTHAMDKAFTKQMMADEGIPTARWVTLTGDETVTSTTIERIITEVGLPAIVKPNTGGSSVALTKVDDRDALPDALTSAGREGERIMVEAFVVGRELTVSVLDGQPLPVVEIRPKHGLYDYAAKYTSGLSEYLVPAPISTEIETRLQSWSVQLYHALSCSGLARVDWLLDAGNNAFGLELNTLPGMTELSLAPMAAKAAGMSFDDLVQRIITAAR